MNVQYALVLAGLLVATAPARAADLVSNGRFDTNLTSWQLAGTPSPIWAPLDVAGAPASGSGLGYNSSSQASDRIIVLNQCVDNLEPGRYFAAGAGYLPSGQAAGRLGISVTGFVGLGCVGGSQLNAGAFISTFDSWRRVSFRGPAGSIGGGTPGSLWFRLFVEKDPAGGTLSGHFDDLVLDRILIEDGFEEP